MYASTSARRASASIRRAPSRTSSSITDDAADRAAPEPSRRSAESETTVSIGSYLPDQRCRAGLAWNLSSVTREGTPHPKPIHRFQALLDGPAAIALTVNPPDCSSHEQNLIGDLPSESKVTRCMSARHPAWMAGRLLSLTGAGR